MLILEVSLTKHNFKGLKCPLPVLKAKRVIKNMEPNEEQVFLCDDPASPIDFSIYVIQRICIYVLKKIKIPLFLRFQKINSYAFL